jgi:outer membrane protein with glycine zipper
MKVCIFGETVRRTMTKRRTELWLLLSVAMVFTAHPPVGAQLYIYPARGQSPQQEESDKGQCYGWAVQQSGFNPANPQVVMPPPPPSYYPQPQAPQGGLFRGAFGGAALGAVGGAIGGDAGKGAAIGAGVGGLFGMMRRHRYMEEEQQMQQEQMQQQQGYMSQEQNALARGRGNYNRAFSACMTARGYTVN